MYYYLISYFNHNIIFEFEIEQQLKSQLRRQISTLSGGEESDGKQKSSNQQLKKRYSAVQKTKIITNTIKIIKYSGSLYLCRRHKCFVNFIQNATITRKYSWQSVKKLALNFAALCKVTWSYNKKYTFTLKGFFIETYTPFLFVLVRWKLWPAKKVYNYVFACVCLSAIC